MSDQERFVDIHCHLLPGLDDGAQNGEESLAMAQMAAADGISVVVATPHQLGGFSQNRGQTIRERVAQLQEQIQGEGIPIDVVPGADVRIEPELIPRVRSGDVLTLADRGRYVLLELPHELLLPMDHLLDQLRQAGLVGILSHPERNQGILAQPHVVQRLVEAGCLMQVTAGSLTGSFGPEVQHVAEQLVQAGLAHFVATDAHGPKARRPLMRRAFDRVIQLVGPPVAIQLCCSNPARVVADHPIVPGRVRTPARRRFRWRKAG